MTRAAATLDIRPGAQVLYRERVVVVTHLLDLESALLKDPADGSVIRAKLADLLPAPSTTNTTASPDLLDIPAADWETAQRRLDIIRPLIGRTDRTRREVEAQAKLHGVTTGTLYVWIATYEGSGRLTSLLTRRRSDKGTTKLQEEVEAIIRAALEDTYLTRQRKTVAKVCEAVRQRCIAADLEPPHPNTVRNRVARLSESLRVKRRLGGKAAEQQFSPNEGEFPGADWPLAIVQIDHTKVDIILVDDIHRLPIGRPWITLAIDIFSRMVCGFYISFDPPGALATGLCIAHAVLPKEQWLAKHDLDVEWPIWGFPKMLHLDNAKEFRGSMLQRACSEYGIDISWRPVARPHFGGHIERLLGTLLKEIHTLPGTTFSNPRERADYDSEGKAALTLREFETWLTTYIAKVYHLRIHSSLGVSPLDKFKEGVFGSGDRPGAGVPARITDEERVRLDFTPYVERTVQDYGVVIDDVHYYHDVLRRWIGSTDPKTKRKRKFLFRRDPRDISRIWFHDPEVGGYFEIPYRDTSHPPISIWEFREAEKHARKTGTPVDERALFAAYDRMREIEAQAQAKTKAARRAQQRRSDGIGASKPAPSTSPSAPAPTSDAPPVVTPSIQPFEDLDDLTDEHS